jgi:hypothetical protein
MKKFGLFILLALLLVMAGPAHALISSEVKASIDGRLALVEPNHTDTIIDG